MTRLADLLPEQPGLPALALTDITQDARAVQPGAAFIALQGVHAHGLNYAANALRRGAAVILWDEAPVPRPPDARLIHIPGLRDHLPLLAQRFFGHWPARYPLLAITGTDGKTSVSHHLSFALTALGQRCAVMGTLGVGAPGALQPLGQTTPGIVEIHRYLAQLVTQGFTAVALEASSHALAQGRLAGITPQVAILTQLGRDHLDYHGSVTAYAEAKARLFRSTGLGACVLNQDDSLGQTLLARHCRAGSLPHCWAYTTRPDTPPTPLAEARCLRAQAIQTTDQGLSFSVTGAGLRDEPVQVALLGEFQVANLLATLGALLALGYPPKDAAAALQHVQGVPGRMERFALPNGATLVVDYAHTALALQSVLQALRPHVAGRLGVVFGCGGDRDPGKRAPMGQVASATADWVIITDDNPRSEAPAAIRQAIMEGCAGSAAVRVIGDREEAIAQAVHSSGSGDVILIAGKGHEAVQTIQGVDYPFSDRALAARWAASTAVEVNA